MYLLLGRKQTGASVSCLTPAHPPFSNLTLTGKQALYQLSQEWEHTHLTLMKLKILEILLCARHGRQYQIPSPSHTATTQGNTQTLSPLHTLAQQTLRPFSDTQTHPEALSHTDIYQRYLHK